MDFFFSPPKPPSPSEETQRGFCLSQLSTVQTPYHSLNASWGCFVGLSLGPSESGWGMRG